MPGWLKGLRLHKYQELFQVMTYDEMVSITDEFLEKKVRVHIYVYLRICVAISIFFDAGLPLPRVSPRVPAIRFFRTSAAYHSGTRHSHKWKR